MVQLFVLALSLCMPLLRGEERCGAIETFADGKKPAREIFVAVDGDDSRGDGSREKPFGSVRRAARELQGGDAIRLLPGTHHGGIYLGDIQGRADAPVWIGGSSKDAGAVIRGGANGIHISGAKYLVVENLEIIGATGNGINCDDGGGKGTSQVVFRNVAFREIGRGGNHDGLKLSGLDDFWVIDCAFEKISKGGSGIDHVGCHRGVVARCWFSETGNAIQCKGGSSAIEVRRCRFDQTSGRAINIGGSTGFAYFRPRLSTNEVNVEARGIRVLANVFTGAEAPVAFVGATESVVANNTIIEPKRWVARILQETVSKDGYEFARCGKNEFVNNLIYYRRDKLSVPVNVGGNTDAASFRFANNLWYAVDAPKRSRPELPASETGGIYGVDPLFESDGKYAVKRESPAAGKGIAVTALGGDYDGHCYGNPSAIGAFEIR